MKKGFLMEEPQLNVRLPRFVKLEIERAAKLSGLSQEAWVENQIHNGLADMADALLEANKLADAMYAKLKRQQKYTSE